MFYAQSCYKEITTYGLYVANVVCLGNRDSNLSFGLIGNSGFGAYESSWEVKLDGKLRFSLWISRCRERYQLLDEKEARRCVLLWWLRL